MIQTVKKYLVLLPVLFLIGCAPAMNSAEMMPKTKLYDQLGESKFTGALVVRKADVQKGLGGATGNVTPEAYKEALISSVRQAGLYAKNGKEKYAVDAYLKQLDQPIFGFNFTVKATADYTITNLKNDKIVYQQTLTLPCTVLFAEEFVADIRLRRATGCAIGENITHFLKTISE